MFSFLNPSSSSKIESAFNLKLNLFFNLLPQINLSWSVKRNLGRNFPVGGEESPTGFQSSVHRPSKLFFQQLTSIKLRSPSVQAFFPPTHEDFEALVLNSEPS
ncbi:hypothetical protein LINGRAHAP2_LOCUS6939 [Linum grandiflorum]